MHGETVTSISSLLPLSLNCTALNLITSLLLALQDSCRLLLRSPNNQPLIKTPTNSPLLPVNHPTPNTPNLTPHLMSSFQTRHHLSCFRFQPSQHAIVTVDPNPTE